jgi:hypothetical protein
MTEAAERQQYLGSVSSTLIAIGLIVDDRQLRDLRTGDSADSLPARDLHLRPPRGELGRQIRDGEGVEALFPSRQATD